MASELLLFRSGKPDEHGGQKEEVGQERQHEGDGGQEPQLKLMRKVESAKTRKPAVKVAVVETMAVPTVRKA